MDTYEGLRDVYLGTALSIADLGATATAEQWGASTACPGWSVGDMVAHATDIEQMFMGEQRIAHEPDFAALPWADDELSRIIELGVDARRTHPQQQVVAELRETIARRRAQLDAGTHDLAADVPGWMGKPSPLGRQMRLRTLDLWTHLVDMSEAIDAPVDWHSPAARTTAQMLLAGQPGLWAKRITAAAGTGVRLVVTGLDESVDLGDGITATITMDVPAFCHRATGRIGAEDATWRRGVVIDGDEVLANAMIEAMVVTP